MLKYPVCVNLINIKFSQAKVELYREIPTGRKRYNILLEEGKTEYEPNFE